MESTVIYVSFGGSEQGQRPAPGRTRGQKKPAPGRERPGFRFVRGAHGLMDLYTAAQAARVLGVTEGRLRWWRKCGLVVPSGREGGTGLYSFRDLVGLKAAKELTDRGCRVTSIKRAIRKLSEDLEASHEPIVRLRVHGNDRRLVADREGREVEAETGQVLIDFRISPLAAEVDRTVAFDPSGRRRSGRRSAYEWFLEGSDLEADDSGWDRAEEAYRKALDLDGSLAAAATNLGNIRYRRGKTGEAEGFYRKAIQADPQQPQAYYNLGFLKLEDDRSDLAIVYFQKALALDPEFSDARFNYAVALEREGRQGEARREFRRFLDLDPSSPWATVARIHMERIDGGSGK